MEADTISNRNVASVHWLCWLPLVKLELMQETKEEHSVTRLKNGMVVEYPSLGKPILQNIYFQIYLKICTHKNITYIFYQYILAIYKYIF